MQRMTHRHSILPVDRWTTGLTDDQLRGLLSRHHVRFEVRPHQVVAADRGLTRHGWEVDLYASRSTADDQLSTDDMTDHLYEVLHAVARAITPVRAARVAIEMQPNTGAVHLDPRNDFAEEVRLRIVIEPHEGELRQSLVADLERVGTEKTDAITTRLEELGCLRR